MILCVVAQIRACPLCALYTPNVYVSVEINGDSNANQSVDSRKSNANQNANSRESSADSHKADSPTIKNIVFLWKFDKKFNQVLLHSYDTNANGVIDKNELKSIETALTSYVLPKNNLTHALLQRTNDKPKPINFRLKKYDIFIQDETLNYRYEIVLDSAPKERFSFMVSDDEGFFNFIIFSQKHTIIGDKRVSSKVIDDNVIIFTIENARNVDLNAFGAQNTAQDSANLNGANLRNESIMDKMFALNAKMLSAIKSHIVGENTGEKSVFGILGLMGLSLLYGILHAAAPGHAKLLTSSYFLAHKGSYAKAFGFALRVGVVHILSAFVLVGLGLFILKIVVQSLANDANAIIMQISSGLIIAVALVLLTQKMRGKHAHTCACASCQNHAIASDALHNHSAQNPHSMLTNALNAMQSTFSNIAPKIDFTKWGMIIAAGIVPCPSMIIVLLLCFEVGFFSALLSAICIAIGMSAVVFISAIFAHKIKTSARSEKLSRFLEYLALCGMLCVGIFMFFNSFAIKSSVF